MDKHIWAVIVSGLLCLALDVKKIHGIRTLSQTSSNGPSRRSQFDDRKQTFTEELKPFVVEYHSERTSAPSKPYCGTNCRNTKKPKVQQRTTTARAKIQSYEALKLSAINNTTVSFPKEKSRFSRKYSDKLSEDLGFLPIPGPYVGKDKNALTAQRRTRLNKNSEEMSVRESRSDSNILGNGHFEILEGGVFSDDETNEISGGRREGRAYSDFIVPSFQRVPFEVVQNFQFPPFYRGRPQSPNHPLFFPRGAYSEKREVKTETKDRYSQPIYR